MNNNENISEIVCPFCGDKMESGALKSPSYRLRWQPGIWEKDKYPKSKKFFTDDTIEQVGESGGMRTAYMKGSRCKSCKKIIVDY